MKLTPTTRRILEFVARGGERGVMELQIISSGGSWIRRYNELRDAGYIENAFVWTKDPDRVRITEAGRAALAGDA